MKWQPAKSAGKRIWLAVGLVLMLCGTGGCKQKSWTLWSSFKARYMDGQGRVIDPVDSRTTSEGEAYGMFFALADNDRESFDRILNWTQANLAQGSLGDHLPAWLWGHAPDGSWRTLDPNTASDADLWMAYSLLEAGRLWRNPAYSQLGLRLAHQISEREVGNLPGFGYMLLPGINGFEHQRSETLHSWTLNPSYLPSFLFDRMATLDPGGPWLQISRNIPRLLEQSSVHGWAMDWVEYIPGDGFHPTVIGYNDGTKPALGSYDAIRVYLWAGLTDPEAANFRPVLNALPAMGAYLVDHDAPPETVNEAGIPGGVAGPVGFSAAVLPYMRQINGREKQATKQLLRMVAERNSSTGLYGGNQAYYDQVLALFSTGFSESWFRFGSGGELKVEWAK